MRFGGFIHEFAAFRSLMAGLRSLSTDKGDWPVMNSPCISIVLSTFNRADMLQATLDWLAEIDVPHGWDAELIVVDNNSSDHTHAIVENFAAEKAIPTRYVFESRQGLSFARNAGIDAANGDLLVFTDDDCFVCGDWLIEIVKLFDERKDLAGAGGRVDLYDERDLPITIRTSREKSVASASNLFALVPGCNMCFRRTTMEVVGVFDERFGAGTNLYSAEDSDYIYRVLKAGLSVEYVPDIRVFHAHGRRTETDARKLARGYVIGRGAFYCKHILGGDRDILKQAYWELRKLMIKLVTCPERSERLQVIGHLLKGGFTYLLLAFGGIFVPKSRTRS